MSELSQVIGGLVRGPLMQRLLVTGSGGRHEVDLGSDNGSVILGTGCSEPIRNDIYYLGFGRGVGRVPFSFEEFGVESVQGAGPGWPLRKSDGRQFTREHQQRAV